MQNKIDLQTFTKITEFKQMILQFKSLISLEKILI